MPARFHWFRTRQEHICALHMLRNLPVPALLAMPIWASQAVDAGPGMPAVVIPGAEQTAAMAAEPTFHFGAGRPRADEAATSMAQGNGPGADPQGGTQPGVAARSDPWPAPTGHRQPQIQDLPANVRQEEGEVTQSERELDKLIGNICRGC